MQPNWGINCPTLNEVMVLEKTSKIDALNKLQKAMNQGISALGKLKRQ